MTATTSLPFLKSPGIRTFLTVWFGQMISAIGSNLTGFALGVYIYDLTGSKILFALNTLAYGIPPVLVAPFTGALVDRIDRKWAMIISDTGAGLSTLAVVLLHLTGQLEIWHIIVATFINSSFTTIQWPAWSAAQTLIVPKEHLGRAGGMVQIGDAAGQLFAPALAGVLFVSIGIGGIIAIDFATFAFAVLTLLLVRIPRPQRSAAGEQAKQSLWNDAQFGFRYIWARKPLLGLLLYFATINFLGGVFVLVGPMFLDLASPEVFGYVSSIVGLGMVIGTVVMSVWGGPQRKINGLLGFGALGGAFMALIGARTHIPLMTLGGFGLMFTFPIINACSQAIWQRKVEPDVQGRVFSARRVIAWSTGLPAQIIAPVLVERFFDPLMAVSGPLAGTGLGHLLTLGAGRGTGALFLLTGILSVFAAVIFYFIPAVRHVESLVPDAVGDVPQADLEADEGEAVVVTAAESPAR